MSKFSYRKNQLYFIRRSLNLLINIGFVAILLLVALCIFFGIRLTLDYVLSFEGYLGDIISAAVSILIFVLPLTGSIRISLVNRLNRFKQRTYIYLCTRKFVILSNGIQNYNQNHWRCKPNQSKVITNAVKILKSKRQGIFAVESFAYGGKTATAMLLLDFIGKNIELLDLFVALKNRILYFDGATEAMEILGFLNSPELLTDAVVIVDNIHKLNPAKLNELIKRSISDAEFLCEINKGCLILLLYQTSSTNNALIHELNEVQSAHLNTIFLSDDDSTMSGIDVLTRSDSNNIELLCRTISNDRQIFRQHLTYLANSDTINPIIKFLHSLINNQKISKKERPFAIVTIAALLIASFQGYINNSDLRLAFSEFHCSWLKYYKNICILKSERFLVDFPLLQSTFLFNEKLANCYKQILFKNSDAEKIYCAIAKKLFVSESIESPKKWLYLVASEASFIEKVDSVSRKQYFTCSIEKYSTAYLLNAIEAELTVAPGKANIFFAEIGTLYIHNGQWKKAREILKPSAKRQSDLEKTWLLQLKIIEADHGTDDRENLIMLEMIIEKSTDSFTRFLACFWKHHINMEQGHFSLKELFSLRGLIDDHPEWNVHEYYNNILRKLNSDSARTYFLTGVIDYQTFQNIMELVDFPYIRHVNSELATQKLLLTQAHYVHYDIIYQLGIWGYYKQSNINPQFQKLDLEQLLDNALKAYDDSIQIYQTGGDKKWRTVQVRRDELSLCRSNCNFIEILSRLDSFYSYSISNDIGVFKGFCDTVRGKAFALYAVSAMGQGDLVRYNDYIDKAKTHLSSAMSIYTQYGNIYGAARAEFLHTLVSMLDGRSNSPVKKKRTFEQHFSQKIHGLLKTYKEEGWQREQDVCGFLLANIKQYNAVVLILKYYPIILQ